MRYANVITELDKFYYTMSDKIKHLKKLAGSTFIHILARIGDSYYGGNDRSKSVGRLWKIGRRCTEIFYMRRRKA